MVIKLKEIVTLVEYLNRIICISFLLILPLIVLKKSHIYHISI